MSQVHTIYFSFILNHSSSLCHLPTPTLGPWNHVACGFIGGYIGYNYYTWESEMLESVNEKRVARGMMPIQRKDLNGGLSEMLAPKGEE
jgi:hypothetical protein